MVAYVHYFCCDMRAKPLVVAAILGIGLMSGAALAQAGKADVFAPMLTDERVKALRQRAVENIHHSQCDGGAACAPAMDNEKRNPPVSLAESRKILRNSYVAAMAQWCTLDWQKRSTLPFLRKYTAGKAYSDRHVALIAVLHGLGQKTMVERLGQYGACPVATRQTLDQRLPQR